MILFSNTSEIESFMEQIQPEGVTCSSVEFINGDDDLVTCFETDDDSWDQQFLASLDSTTGTSSDHGDEEEEEEEELGPPQPKVKNLSEAISHLEGEREYLDSKGHLTEATIISSAVYILHCKNRQSRLDGYLLQSKITSLHELLSLPFSHNIHGIYCKIICFTIRIHKHLDLKQKPLNKGHPP